MVKKNLVFIACLLLFAGLPLIAADKTEGGGKMKGVAFIPDVYNSLDFSGDVSTENKCTEHYDWISTPRVNTIDINTPEKIIFDTSAQGFEPVIPVCGAYLISANWGLKYHNLPVKVLYIRRADEDKWYSGRIDRALRAYKKFGINQHPAPSPLEKDKAYQKKLKREREKAQSYTDEELKSGQANGSAFTENLLDYVEIPLTSGIYEIYMSSLGIESNKVKVEIIFKYGK